MPKNKKTDAADIAEDDLDKVQGGGLMDTPIGGWGVSGSAQPNAGATTDPRRTRFSTGAGGDPNV